MLTLAAGVRRKLEQNRAARDPIPVAGTSYTLELETTLQGERWILSLTARKPELYHTAYLCRGSREEVRAFLSAQTSEAWDETAGKLLREADAIYFP